MSYRKKLIEVALPLAAMNKASASEKSIRQGHPSTLHLWWARRPLATCRSILFAQLVDDPSSWPDEFPTEQAQDEERERLFDIMRRMVPWSASNDEGVLAEARWEIARSHARCAIAEGDTSSVHRRILEAANREQIREYLLAHLPPVRDPFAGGGSIPLEARRLGLRAEAADLNPVAVLLNRIQLESTSRVDSCPPVHEEASRTINQWSGTSGLAEDLRHYGRWIHDQAWAQIGNLYPVETKGLAEHEVVAWFWVRTVASPDPGANGSHVPLVANHWLCRKKGREAWLELNIAEGGASWSYNVRSGPPPQTNDVAKGTKVGRGTFRCVLTGATITPAYLKKQGADRFNFHLVAMVVKGERGREYMVPGARQLRAALSAVKPGLPRTRLGRNSRHLTPIVYGYDSVASLYTARQATALSTFCALVPRARELVRTAALRRGWSEERADYYADVLASLLALTVSRRADKWSTFSIWDTSRETVQSLIRLSAVQMTWEFVEANPFSTVTGNYLGGVEFTAKAIERLGSGPEGACLQSDARIGQKGEALFCTDPPYYDNVPYADLSDLFYTWLRTMLRSISPNLMATMTVPKASELVADPVRQGGKEKAQRSFQTGMADVLRRLFSETVDAPLTIFYAFKQRQKNSGVSTGWETFLNALVQAGFMVVGTWPVRTEQGGGLRAVGRNALATSVVLVCRKRPESAGSISSTDLRRRLQAHLPGALRHLERGNIAPVDLAQAAIGPGMAVYSSYKAIVNPDGTMMGVAQALKLINEVLDGHLSELEANWDNETRFAVTWYESFAFEQGPYGQAETLAKARNVVVSEVSDAGLLSAGGNRVRLHPRQELPESWDPRTDTTPTVWESTQHLVKCLEEHGEDRAAKLLSLLGGRAEDARTLAYRLYSICERKGWMDEARSYNTLVHVWPELARLATDTPPPTGPQKEMF